MKFTQLSRPIVVTSWLATVILTVVGFTCGAQRLLIAQQPASPGTVAGRSPANQNPPAAASVSQADPNLQVLMQGAVHEAFGQPVLFNPIPNPVISQQPPAPIEEMPPSMKPVGNDVQWIPGYWSWEAMQQKFVWTSGIWRVIPPGLAWMPGYWMQSGTGYQWVSGFWNRSGTATALASFSKQMGGNGLVSPFAAAPTNPVAATAITPTPNPTGLGGATPIANPTNAPGTDPSVVFPPAATSPAIQPNPTSVPGTNPSVVFPPPAASLAIPAGSTAAPVAVAGGPTILGAVPGPNPTTPTPLPGTAFPDTAPNPAATSIASVDPAANVPNAGVANPVPTNPTATAASGSPFVPQPPPSLESGPVGDPPTADCIWIPGTWIYRHGRFLWLAGQWSPIQRGWVWIPAHYVWTPAGHVFVDGYWDYELGQRGVLFAPVSFRRRFHGWGFTYTPSVVLNTDLLTDCLFVNGSCGCYCFGDYYGENCAQAGIFPWFAFHMSSLGYDPCFAFASWANHRDLGWHEKLVGDFRALRSDETLRPPHTLDDSRAHHWRPRENSEPLGKFVARTGPTSVRFENLSTAERGEIERSVHRSQRAASRRSEVEATLARHEPNQGDKRPADLYMHSMRGAEDPTDNRVESKVGEQRSESKLSEGKGESKIAQPDSPVIQGGRMVVRRSTAETPVRQLDRTPPVVPRRPVSTTELSQHAIKETPDQRLANPKFVPLASNRGRSEPAQKATANRHH